MSISTAFFDLGSTLVYSKEPWQSFYEKADRALVDVLQNAGYEIEPPSFSTQSGGLIRTYYDRQEESNFEPTSFIFLRDFLSQRGFKDIPESVLRNSLQAMYAITQQNWFLEEDAISTLETLRNRGYRLGIISNTSDDRNVQVIVDSWGLRSFFEAVITSAALGIRKPDARIFQFALDQFQVSPDSAVMVGDTLDADILGANQAGITSIWITRRIQQPGDGILPIQPQAVVSTLSQIPDLLFEIEKDRSNNSPGEFTLPSES